MIERKKQMLKSKQKVKHILSRYLLYSFVSVGQDVDGCSDCLYPLLLSSQYCLGKGRVQKKKKKVGNFPKGRGGSFRSFLALTPKGRKGKG